MGRAPSGPWLATWILALVVAALALAAQEVYWRAAGLRPSVSDTEDLWASERARVYSRGSDDSVLVLVGGSRMQQGVSIPTLEAALPGFRIVQLGIASGNAMPVLGDLATDPDFAGVVIVSIVPSVIWGSFGPAREYVDHFRSGPGINVLLNTRIDAAVQGRLVVRLRPLSLASRVRRFASGEELAPNYSIMNRARVRLADYTLRGNLAAEQARRVEEAREPPSRWTDWPRVREVYADSVAQIAGWVAAIAARGGRVALVHFPVGEQVWAYSEALYPRDFFWATVETTVPGPVIHYLDYPSLSQFELPDESHLDQKDLPAFTEALLAILREEGFF